MRRKPPATAAAQPSINLSDARAFLAALDPVGNFTFQAIHDGPHKAGKSMPMFHGTLKDHQDRLVQLNQQGYGVFVMVNEGDGQGRKATNVTRVRAHFLDLDGAPVTPPLAAEATPHILVESSPKRWHVYWRTEDCPLHQFRDRQKQLIQRFRGDPVVCDLPRVMRLPGFLHQKREPFTTRLVPQTEWKSLLENQP